MVTCKVPDCPNPLRARGWCNAHWNRWKKYGDPRESVPLKGKRRIPICSIEGCVSHATGRGWCNLHYQRWKNHGDPFGGNPGPKVRVAIVHEDGTKECTVCGERKPIEDFGRDKRAHGGRRSQCKKCRVKKVSADYYNDRERILARMKAHREANADTIRARDSARYYRDKEKRIALVTDSVHRRRVRIKDAVSDKGITHKSLRDRDGDQCYLCGEGMSFVSLPKGQYEPRRATIEHLIPVSRGGTHTWDNVALSCWECNMRRGRKQLVVLSAEIQSA